MNQQEKAAVIMQVYEQTTAGEVNPLDTPESDAAFSRVLALFNGTGCTEAQLTDALLELIQQERKQAFMMGYRAGMQLILAAQ